MRFARTVCRKFTRNTITLWMRKTAKRRLSRLPLYNSTYPYDYWGGARTRPLFYFLPSSEGFSPPSGLSPSPPPDFSSLPALFSKFLCFSKVRLCFFQVFFFIIFFYLREIIINISAIKISHCKFRF